MLEGSKCVTFWCWRTTSFSGVSHSAPEVQQGKCAHLLRDLDATVDLPAHCSLVALQVLDLTHRCWSEYEGPGIEEGDVFTVATTAYIGIKLHSARYLDPAPFLRPDPQQPRHPSRLFNRPTHGSRRFSRQAPTSQLATFAHSPGCA